MDKRTDSDAKKEKSLSVELPPDLLGRVNAMAQLLGIKQPEYVSACLEEKTEQLETIQAAANKWLQSRRERSKRRRGKTQPPQGPEST